jgi:hypothetical protein
MALPLIAAGVVARSAAKKVAKKVATSAAKKAAKKDVDYKVVGAVTRAVSKGQDPVKFIKSLDKKVNKQTLRDLTKASINDVPVLSPRQLDKLIGPKVSPKKIAQAVAEKKSKTKVATPSSVKTKDGVFTVKKTPTGKIKVTDPKGKSTKLPRGKTAQSYFTNQRPR